jgi:WD domain, G-beta repeat/Anaphase-promoting complex subunit 4 WD40 domain
MATSVSSMSFGLQESGFVHSAFTFAYESLLGRSNIRNAEKTIPPGALISFLQKGLQYVGIEENLQREGAARKKSKGQNESNEFDQNGDIADFTLLAPKTIRALTRDRPPIQLNVPPAAAAAAIKARLEVEAKIQAETKAAVAAVSVDEHPAQRTSITGSVPTQQSHDEQQTYSRTVNLNAEQAAAVMNQFHQGGTGLPAGAAAFAAQQQRVAEAQLAALQHQEMVIRQDPSQTAAAAIAFMSTHNKVGRVGRKGKSYQGFGGVQGSSSEPSSVVALHLQQPSNTSVAAAETVETVESQPHAEVTGNAPMDIDDDKHSPPASHKYINGIDQTAVSDHNGLTGVNAEQGISTNGQGKTEMEVSRMDPRVRQDPAHTSDNSLSQDAAIDEEDMKTQASPSEVLELNKHSSEVFMCAWNPVFTDLIATGSGDASARIWQMGGPDASGGCSSVRELPHGLDPNDRKNKDVTTLEWSSDGKLLATGSYDGVARVWSRTGVLVHTLSRHRGPIFSLKWNRSGNYLLSGSYDQTTIVWDVSGSSGQVVQQFNDHSAPALDVDWKDDTTFASCSTDKRVLICRVGVDRPLRIYSGHLDEVNAVKWDPSGTLLASCSDDFTAKVWNVASDKSEPLYDFKDHKAEIYTLKW